jgi:hypothetical protein
VTHPAVPMVQAFTKHVEQLVVLPDELPETCIHKFRNLCESCGCKKERELASHLAAHWSVFSDSEPADSF